VSPGRLLDDVPFSPFRAPAGHGAGSGAAEAFAEEQRRLEEAEKAAFERGLGQAREQAKAEVEKALGGRLTRLDEALAELASLRGRVLDELRGEIFGLVVEVASRLLRERLEADDPVVLRAVEEALAERRAETRWRIRIHPEDLAQLDQREQSARTLDLVADTEITRGGLIAESSGESIDARVETAIAALHRAFEEPR
jgi:flagellar biosynthesis/type III secretory pathway protein FliH